ncbi:MAG: carbon-nitrogen hydrolase family protein [Armatimonadetes bacterium]|nr:carbon-nitrogen hydrolase family protein [Armatimonadota bacterium]
MRRAKLAAVQISARPGGKQANLERIGLWASRAGASGVDLVCFPELCTTALAPGLPAELAESIPGPTTDQLAGLAKQYGFWMVVGMIEANPDGGKPYNAAVVLDPTGAIASVYRKVYLFAGEREAFARGDQPCLLDLPFARAAVTICYDFIFPSYIAGLVDRGAELILHPTNWLTTQAWVELGYDQQEYRAVGLTRAVENTAWFLSANRYGPSDDSATFSSIGQSSIIAPWGRVLAEVEDGEGLAIAEVDFDAAATWREQVAGYLEDRQSVDPWGET